MVMIALVVRAVCIEAARAGAGTYLLALTPQQQTALVMATTEVVTLPVHDEGRRRI
jgi:hypothetical protein